MYTKAIKNYVSKTLKTADIHINGNRSWDFQVQDHRFFPKIFWEGSLGLGEAYTAGWVDSPELDAAICRLLQSPLAQNYNPPWMTTFRNLGARVYNLQSKNRAYIVGEKHYDLSNELFQCMLDKRMTYSCGYWKTATTLDQAQEAKLELVCQKLFLKPGMRVLDIGCGWGSFAKYAAEKYGVHVVGITVSKEQVELARKLCQGLPIDIRFQDYRDIREQFDRIVSIGQMEHVGYKNYRTYMEIAAQALKDNGMFLLHTIGNNQSVRTTDPWIHKYIFPNGMIPSAVQLASASEGLLIMEDWHNFGPDYDKTLLAWHHNFEAHWNELKGRYNEQFRRMWKYYLLTCAGAFRARQLQLWQIVYTKRGLPEAYRSPR